MEFHKCALLFGTVVLLYVLLCGQCNSTIESNSFRIVYITAPSRDVAIQLSRGLVSGGLAACVNIVPTITSIYMWQGEVNEDTEVLLIVKTLEVKVAEITRFVKENMSYSVPEVISVAITDGNPDYLNWIRDTVATNRTGEL